MIHPVQVASHAATPQTVQPEPGRLTPKRLMRHITAVFSAIALVFSGSILFSGTAHAAPGDPVVFVDQALEDAVNDALGQSPGDVITEAQAAGFNGILNADGLGIADLSGIEYLTGLTRLYLQENTIADVSPLTALTNLTILRLDDNAIVDVSPLTTLTNLGRLDLDFNAIADVSPLTTLTSLESLYLNDNAIVDVSPLTTLTNLKRLDLDYNAIADVSPLTTLTSLETLYLNDQSITMPATGVNTATVNPVVDAAGDPVEVTSTDTNFSFDAGANTWTFDGTGVGKTMTWDTNVTFGSLTEVRFNGTITQDIYSVPTALIPEDPVVVQAVCVAGDVTGPTITLPEGSEAIQYDIDGIVKVGATVTVTAHAVEGYVVEVPVDSDWALDSSGFFATLEITLDPVDCDVPPVVDPPTAGDDKPVTQPDTDGLAKTGSDQSVAQPDTDELAKTGFDQSVAQLGVLGALLALAGTGLVLARRRMSTR